MGSDMRRVIWGLLPTASANVSGCRGVEGARRRAALNGRTLCPARFRCSGLSRCRRRAPVACHRRRLWALLVLIEDVRPASAASIGACIPWCGGVGRQVLICAFASGKAAEGRWERRGHRARGLWSRAHRRAGRPEAAPSRISPPPLSSGRRPRTPGEVARGPRRGGCGCRGRQRRRCIKVAATHWRAAQHRQRRIGARRCASIVRPADAQERLLVANCHGHRHRGAPPTIRTGERRRRPPRRRRHVETCTPRLPARHRRPAMC
mmetsp:Transcript_111083/g.321032  ORF Transcript_111083/g.321032 Transcript_111083/m.321032 type:complete len:264 (-) Transcript_111083:58-849(-)